MTGLERSVGGKRGARTVELVATATAVVLASKLLLGRGFLRLPAAVIAAGLIGSRRRSRGPRRARGAGEGTGVETPAAPESGVPAVHPASAGDGGGGAARMGGAEAASPGRPGVAGEAAKRRRKRAASRARNRAREEAKERESHAGGWHPEPEVVEVKSPAELEPGIASASPTPTFSNRVDRGRGGRSGARREAPARAASEQHEPGAPEVSRGAGYLAPDVGAGVREGDLGAVSSPDEAPEGEAERGEPRDARD